MSRRGDAATAAPPHNSDMELFFYLMGGVIIAAIGAASIRAISHKSPSLAASLMFIETMVSMLIIVSIIQNIARYGTLGVFMYALGVFIGTYTVLTYTK